MLDFEGTKNPNAMIKYGSRLESILRVPCVGYRRQHHREPDDRKEMLGRWLHYALGDLHQT